MNNNSEEAQTKPTLETVLERINSLGGKLEEQLGALKPTSRDESRCRHSLKNNVDSVIIEVGGLRMSSSFSAGKWKSELIESKE